MCVKGYMLLLNGYGRDMVSASVLSFGFVIQCFEVELGGRLGARVRQHIALPHLSPTHTSSTSPLPTKNPPAIITIL